jgi:hypothetical protein
MLAITGVPPPRIAGKGRGKKTGRIASSTPITSLLSIEGKTINV